MSEHKEVRKRSWIRLVNTGAPHSESMGSFVHSTAEADTRTSEGLSKLWFSSFFFFVSSVQYQFSAPGYVPTSLKM